MQLKPGDIIYVSAYALTQGVITGRIHEIRGDRIYMYGDRRHKILHLEDCFLDEKEAAAKVRQLIEDKMKWYERKIRSLEDILFDTTA